MLDVRNVMTFHVPGPPVPKARPRWSRRSRTWYTPRRTEDYEIDVGWEALRARVMPFNCDYRGRVKVSMVFRVRGRCDIDNAAKVILDACNKILWKDDSQVVEQHVTLERGAPYGATVTVEVL